MHFLVQNAEIAIVLDRLPAFVVFAHVNFALEFGVLAEIQSFCREHFGSDRDLEVLVRDQAVAIEVKLHEDLVEFVLRNVHAPEIKKVPEFSFAYLSGFFYI
tara:strand:- start:182 stop:487 length:306 start_codon:yes stop_codon:yes gene_type:complete